MSDTNVFSKILVPTDFSDVSLRGLRYASGLAKATGAKLEVLYVLDHLVPDSAYFVPIAPRVYFDEKARTNAEEELDRLCRKEIDESVSYTRQVLLYPHPEVAITDQAKQGGADLIVMGTHGRSGLSHFFLGSVAEVVLRKAHCPVMIVGPDRGDQTA